MIKNVSYKIATCDLCGKEQEFPYINTFPVHLGWDIVKIGEERKFEVCPECLQKIMDFLKDERIWKK